jgi:mannosyl-3-phosphoglycerate phosphatase family protein
VLSSTAAARGFRTVCAPVDIAVRVRFDADAASMPSRMRSALDRGSMAATLKRRTQTVVFSPVDDALLQGQPSSTVVAQVVEAFRDEGITVVFCSHGTRAEIEAVRQAIGVFHPFICENGAAVVVPGGYFGPAVANTRTISGYQVIEFAKPHAYVVETLRKVSARLEVDVVTFSDMTVEQIARECGLSLMQARFATRREYDEAIRIVNDDVVARNRLMRGLATACLICTSRGDFDYVGTVSDAGSAVAVLTALYRIVLGGVFTIGIGDCFLNLPVRRRVDLPVTLSPELGSKPARVSTPSAETVPTVIAWAHNIIKIVRDARETPFPRQRHHAQQ